MVNRYENIQTSYNFIIPASEVKTSKPKSPTTEKTEGIGKQFFSRIKDFFSSNSVNIRFIVDNKAYDVTITGDRSQIKVIKHIMLKGDPTDFGLSVAKIISATLKELNKNNSSEGSPSPNPTKKAKAKDDNIPAYDMLPGTPLPRIDPKDMPD